MGRNTVILLSVLIVTVFISGCTNQTSTTGRIVDSSTNESETPKQQEAVKVEPPKCISNWDCSGWSACSPSETHIRTCVDLNNCGINKGKPIETEKCIYVFSLGDTIEKSGLSITPLKVRTDYHIGKYYSTLNQYQNEAESGKKFVIVYIDAINKENQPQYVSPLDVQLVDRTGVQYTYDSSTFSLSDPFESRDLLSGGREYGEISFEVPESINVSSLKLVYEIDRSQNLYATWDLGKTTITESVRTSCGSTGQICCDNQCIYGNVCINNVCQECGGDKQPPCADGCDFGAKLIGDKCREVVWLCEVDDIYYKAGCYEAQAVLTGDKSWCDFIEEPKLKSECLV